MIVLLAVIALSLTIGLLLLIISRLGLRFTFARCMITVFTAAPILAVAVRILDSLVLVFNLQRRLFG
jgi:hypothetical protein